MKLLAFDTATEHMSIALGIDGDVLTHEAAGGALASATLIPAVLALAARAGIALRALDAIAFGRGPGAFTGLRTACSVAQGLAFGNGTPVLAIDSLLAVAEDARAGRNALEVWVAMDARMDEVYAAHYAFASSRWQTLASPMLVTPATLNALWRPAPPRLIAGSALAAFGARLDTGDAERAPTARPRAAAMLPLAEAAWVRGEAVGAAHALPLYLRDKVAQTTVERAAALAARLASRDAADPAGTAGTAARR